MHTVKSLVAAASSAWAHPYSSRVAVSISLITPHSFDPRSVHSLLSVGKSVVAGAGKVAGDCAACAAGKSAAEGAACANCAVGTYSKVDRTACENCAGKLRTLRPHPAHAASISFPILQHRNARVLGLTCTR